MIARLAALLGRLVGAMSRRDVRLVADDWVDAVLGALFVELDGAEEIAVIGHGNRVHAERLGELHQLRHPARAVEKAVMRVAMQMHERSLGHEDDPGVETGHNRDIVGMGNAADRGGFYLTAFSERV